MSTLHIWLARFEEKKDYDLFFAENYSEDDEDSPISLFAASQAKTYYDHDWLEEHFDVDSIGQAAFVSKIIPNKYVAIVEQMIEERKISDLNAIVLFYDEWSGMPKSKSSDPALWYLGEFNDRTVAALRIPIDFKPSDIPSDWWTDFPGSPEELGLLENESGDSKIRLATYAKLAVMYMSGTYVKQDLSVATSYFNKVEPYPELLSECLLANGNAGNGDAWLRLFQMNEDELGNFTGLVSKETMREYLNKAVELDSVDAKHYLASFLMYDWRGSKYGIEENHVRAEKILLDIFNKHDSGEYQLYCLYSMQDSELYDPEKAFHWLSIHATRSGSSGTQYRMAKHYQDEEGAEKNQPEMCKWIYLTQCQDEKECVKYFKDALDGCEIEEIERGRILGKEWIKEYGNHLQNFGGEKCDPFLTYLQERSQVE